jgi:hypothetical protein
MRVRCRSESAVTDGSSGIKRGSRPGWILSHSTWRDEKSVVRWRTVAKHHETQQRGRDEVFQDYHLRVGEIVLDTAPPRDTPIAEQPNQETRSAAQARGVTHIWTQPWSQAARSIKVKPVAFVYTASVRSSVICSGP